MTKAKTGKYGLIKVEDAKVVPSDCPIADLRFKGGYYYGHAWSKLHSNAIEGLKAAGIVLVSHLKGQSHATLVKLKGVGTETATRLLNAAKKASVNYRGDGFPYDFLVKIEAPNEALEYLRDIGAKEIQALISTHVESVFFTSIEENVRGARMAKVQVEIDAIDLEIENAVAKVAAMREALAALEA